MDKMAEKEGNTFAEMSLILGWSTATISTEGEEQGRGQINNSTIQPSAFLNSILPGSRDRISGCKELLVCSDWPWDSSLPTSLEGRMEHGT
ncbi:hypothetical protein Y1Q_0015621 [Alligator mississippiensis]|uniref:Uncharacterized protein n=1 Tax=Alligator mississippiensis TaxID=8496 RepID=A0A151NNK1_ALLMI|nr:hypothetical protein Y1Q_0015621 [Alligator mississippiensis]